MAAAGVLAHRVGGLAVRHTRRMSLPSAAAIAPHELLLARTYLRLTGKALSPGLDEKVLFGLDDRTAAARSHEQLWNADFALLSHGTQPSPIINYGNLMAMNLFEVDWKALTSMESKYTAQQDVREDRQELLQRVREYGYVDDYTGIRISATGKLFRISQATVWELHCPKSGVRLGQAATFRRPTQPV